MATLKNTQRLFQETLKEWLEDGASSIAASLAYYTIFSLSPLLILIALMIGIVMDQQQVEDTLLNNVETTVGAEVAQTFRNLLHSSEEREGDLAGTAIWIAVIVWGASGLFAQLQNALNKIWEVKAMPGRSPWYFIKNRIISASIVLLAGVTLLSTMVINTGISYAIETIPEVADTAIIIRPLQLIISVVMTTFLFAMIYKVLPDVIIGWKDVWIGAAFTSFLFFLGQFAVGLYLSNSDIGSVFGAAGSLTVVLVWIYYSAQILLFGAEFTEVWARHHGSSIRPDEGAIWINEAQARREAEAAGVEFVSTKRKKEASKAIGDQDQDDDQDA